MKFNYSVVISICCQRIHNPEVGVQIIFRPTKKSIIYILACKMNLKASSGRLGVFRKADIFAEFGCVVDWLRSSQAETVCLSTLNIFARLLS